MFESVSEPSFRLDIAGLSPTLEILSFSGTERISRPFVFELDVLAPDSSDDLSALLHRSAYLSLGGPGEGIHGQIHNVRQSRQGVCGARWHLRLGPRLACLGQRVRQRVFQNASAPQIISVLLKEHGIGADAHRFDLGGDCPEQAFLMQCQETDLQLLHRLCAQTGIHYHFQHSRSAHLVVFSDGRGNFRRVRRAAFCGPDSDGAGIAHFSVRAEVREKGLGGRSEQSAEGESDLPYLRSGALTMLSGHPYRQWNHLWLLTELQHRGTQVSRDPASPFNDEGIGRYQNHFQAIPWEVAFDPGTPDPKPHKPGLYRARVAAAPPTPAGSDRPGRVAVLFEGFPEGEGLGRGACWVPVSSALIGSNQACAREWAVGREVLVGFLEGDSDQPMIMACLEPSMPSPPGSTSGSGAELSQLRADPQRFVEPRQSVHLSGDATLNVESPDRLLFRPEEKSSRLGADSLSPCSSRVILQAPQGPSTQGLSDKSASDLLDLMQASHPLILLCRQPGGGSFSRCLEPACLCRGVAKLGPKGGV